MAERCGSCDSVVELDKESKWDKLLRMCPESADRSVDWAQVVNYLWRNFEILEFLGHAFVVREAKFADISYTIVV